jgi:glucosamine--fructose-6-phosphate aminotransferase (isomerizing)
MVEASFLYREIHEQPDAIANLLAQERTSIQAIAAELNRRRITNVFVAARGTSDNAGRYAQYLLGAVNRLPVGLAAPSLSSIYRRPPRFADALIIGISQSGASPDIVSVLAEARAQGVATLAITNVPTSPLAATAEHIIPLHAGE